MASRTCLFFLALSILLGKIIMGVVHSLYKFTKFITGLYRFITAFLELKTCRKKCLNVESKHICLENCFSLISLGVSGRVPIA